MTPDELERRKATNKKIYKIFGLILLVLVVGFVGLGLLGNSLENKDSAKIASVPANTAPPLSPAPPPRLPTLAVTVDQWMNDYADVILHLPSLPSLQTVVVKEVKTGPKGAWITGQYALSPHSAVVASHDPENRKLQDMTFLGVSDGTGEAGGNITISLLALLQSLTPQQSPAERKAMIDALGIDAKTILDGKTRHTTINGMEMSFTGKDHQGNIRLDVRPVS